MALTTSTQNPFLLVDRTEELLLLPKNETLMNDSGIWQDEFLATRTVTFEERKGQLFIVKDQPFNGRPQTVGNQVRKLHAYGMTHHPFHDALYPQDIQGVSRPGAIGVNQFDTKERALMVKLEACRRSYDRTMNFARFRTLATGDIWAPNGTLQGNFYTDFGLTRQVVDLELDDPTFDVQGALEGVVAGFMVASTEGTGINKIIGYASGKAFSKLINHPKVQAAYNLYAAIAPQQISRDRAGGLAMHRRFVFNNIEFIEVLGAVDGTDLVNDGEIVFVANDGEGAFRTYYGPANRFGYVNTIAADSYLWTQEKPDGTEISIDAEMNMINILRRPDLVATGRYIP